jgi:hypothetical protein
LIMAGHKRTKRERENDLLLIAEMHANFTPQREIAAAIGVTQGQISHDLKEVYRRWAEPDKTNMAIYKARMLAKLRAHEKTARTAWVESLTPKETVSKKQVSTPGGIVGDGADAKVIGDKERNEASLRTENRDGNPAFLHSIEWCIEQEIKMRGLDAPQKAEISGRGGKPIEFVEVVRTVVVGSTPPEDDGLPPEPSAELPNPPKPKTTPPGPPMPGGLQFE